MASVRILPRWLLLASACALSSVSGCSSREQRNGPKLSARTPERTSSATHPGGSASKIQVEDGAGQHLFALDPSEKGFHVEREGGQKIGSVKVEADRVKVSDAQDRPRFKVKRKDDGFKLYREPPAPGGTDVELADVEVRGQEFRIRSAAGQELYRGRPKEAKTKVTGPGGRVFDVKPKENGLEVEDASGRRLIRLKGLNSAPAAVVCAAPEYDPLAKAAVAAFAAKVGR